MNPPRHATPRSLAPRLIVLGGVLACAALAARHVPSREWAAFLMGTASVTGDGSTLIAAMHDRFGTSLLILLGAMILAVSSGMALTLAARRIGLGLPSLLAFACRLLALVPVVALAWTAVGWIVGVKGWPVESLLPHHPAPDRDTWQLAAGREAWKWLVPCWLLALPVGAEFVARAHDCLRRRGASPLNAALHARGLKRSHIFHRHTLALARGELLEIARSLGFVALGWLVFVEDALGIPGWGAFFAAAIKSGDVRGMAASVYVAGWLAAAWCLLASIVRRGVVANVDRTSPDGAAPPPVASGSAGVLASVLAFTLLGCSFAQPPSAGGWMESWTALLSPLVHDLRLTAAACALAVVVAAVLGLLSRLMHRLHLSPRVTDTLALSPALVWALAACSLTGHARWVALGLFMAPAGARLMRAHWSALAGGGVMEAALVMGAGRFRAWRTHVLPGLLRLGLAWSLEAFAQLLVWLTLVETLRPSPASGRMASLGGAISLAKENVLADVRPVLAPALVAAICALFFRQLSHIVRPAPPSP